MCRYVLYIYIYIYIHIYIYSSGKSAHIREGRILVPVRPRMQAAGLQCAKLQIAAAFPDPQTRAFPGTEFSWRTWSPNLRSTRQGVSPARSLFCALLLEVCGELRRLSFSPPCKLLGAEPSRAFPGAEPSRKTRSPKRLIVMLIESSTITCDLRICEITNICVVLGPWPLFKLTSHNYFSVRSLPGKLRHKYIYIYIYIHIQTL